MTKVRVLLAVLLVSVVVVQPVGTVRAVADPACPDVLILGSRGSGEKMAYKPISDAGIRFYWRLQGLLSPRTVSYWANPYSAVPVARSSENDNGWLSFITGGLSLLNLGKYPGSVAEGEFNLRVKIHDTIRDCGRSTSLVIVGYSQGAEVSANVYQSMTADQRAHVLGVVLFGDPLFNGADETVDRGDYDPERNGILSRANGGPRPEFQEPQKVLSYCHKLDPVCQGIFRWTLLVPLVTTYDLAQHTNYHSMGNGPDDPTYPVEAAAYFANRVRPAPPSAGPTAEITPVYDQPPGMLFRISACASGSEGRPLTFAWDLDNSGSFATRSPGCVLRTSFPTSGDYPVAVRVTNDAGQSSVATAVVHVVDPGQFTDVPQAPTNVVSTPSAAGVSATLTWQPPLSGPPAEGYRVFTGDGIMVKTLGSDDPLSYSVNATELPLSVMVQSINRVGDGGGISAPVTMAVAGGVPNGDLNAMWNAYGDQGGHWTGGDRTASVPLPDGRVAWLFSDTFLGTVNADHSRPANSPLVHNTLVVENLAGLGATLHGGTASAPRSLVEVSDSPLQYWVADGMVEGGTLRVLYNLYEYTGGGGLDVRASGTALATFSLPSLTLTGLRTLPLGTTIAWGSEILTDGGYTYIYGAEHNADMPKYLHLARVPAGGLDGAWEFWTGTGWSGVEFESVPMLTGVGTAFSVAQIGPEYVLVTMDANIPFNSTMVAYTATQPTGPFGNPRIVYEAPEAGAGGRPIIVYDATAHPEHSLPGRLTVSYNVNSLNPADIIADVRLYRPRFVNLAWPPPPGPDSAQRPPAPTSLTVTDLGNGNARLSWQPVPGTGITYRVQQKDDTLGQADFAQRPEKYPSTTAEVPFLRDQHRYEFRVVAANSVGVGPPSNTVGLTMRVPPPAPPTNLRATPNDTGGIALAWNASTSSGSIWYRVYRRAVTVEPTEFRPINFPNSNTTSVTDADLEQDRVYEYKVTANRSGQESGLSNMVQATAHYAPPPAPANLRATPRPDGQIDLAWDPPPGGEVWYFVYQRDISNDPESELVRWEPPITTGPSATATFLTSGNTYEFAVSATNRGGEGPRSPPVQATARMAPPAAPTYLTATAPGDGTIRLSWTAPPGEVWHFVYQRNVSAQEEGFTGWGIPITEGTTATATLLNPGNVYEFQVSATNAGGEGPRSNTARATAVVAPPPPPTGLTATPNPDGTIGLSWTAPRDGLWYFVYQRDIAVPDFTRWELPVTSGTSATAGYLDHNRTYEFKITSAYAGVESSPTAPVRATARVAPPTQPPTGLVATPLNDGRAQLSWTGPGPNLWYWVYQRDVTAGQATSRWPVPVTEPHAIADFLVNGHTYEFSVSATNAGGEGPRSAAVQLVARGGTPLPPTLSASPGDGQATLSWTAVADADYYWIYRRNVSTGDAGYRRFGPASGLSHTDTFLTNGDTYEYRVAASNVHGEGAWSAAVRVRPLPPLPPTPTGLVATPGDGKVTLRWNAVPNAWYIVEHRNASAGQSFQWTPTLSSATTWTHTFLANGSTYEYRVRATNIAGNSPPSGTVTARPMPPFPQPPSGLLANPGDAQVTLTWQPSSTPNVWYWIEYRMTGRNWIRLQYPVTTCCRLTMLWLANGTTYEFRVRSTNLSGDSTPSNVVSARPMPPFPAAPSDLRYTFTGTTSVRLAWSPSPTPRVYYYIYYRDNSNGDYAFSAYNGYPIVGTSFDIGYLQPGHRFEFFVVAVNLSGTSGRSNHVFINPGPPDDVSRCASVASSYRGVLGGGHLQSYFPRSTVCGHRRGDTLTVDMSWTSYANHLNDGAFWYTLIDCRTGAAVWYDIMGYENNPSITTDSRRGTAFINSGHYYRVRTFGYGHVEDGNYNNTFANATPPGIIPFDATSPCF